MYLFHYFMSTANDFHFGDNKFYCIVLYILGTPTACTDTKQ